MSDKYQFHLKTRPGAKEGFPTSVCEITHDALVGLDDTLIICQWNPAATALFGIPAEEALGQSAGALLHSSLTTAEKRQILEALQRQGKISFQTVISTKDGTPRAVDINMARLRREDGTPAGYAAALREIPAPQPLVRQLAGAKAQLEALIAHIPVGVVVADAEGEIILANQAAVEIMHGPVTGDIFSPQGGYTLHRLDGSPFPQDELPLPAAIRTGAANGPAEILVRRVDGEEIILQASAAPYYDHQERFAGAIAVLQDITQRRKDERERERMVAELQLSEERFRTSVENLMDGFAIFSAVRDPNQPEKIIDFRYEYINQAGCRLNQRSYEEQVGHRLLELLPAHRESGFFERYVRLVETGEPVHEEDSYYEDLYGDGQRLGRVFDVRAVKLGDGFVVTWTDISQRKQVEARLQSAILALQASEERFRGAVLAAPFPIMIHDEQGQILTINDAWLNSSGYPAQALPTLAAWNQKSGSALHQTMPEQQAAEGEMRVVTSSGQERVWDFYAAPLGRDLDGNRLVIRMAVDVTRRKEVEATIQDTNQRLERSNRELEQFAFVASHDLQEPLRKIRQFSRSVQTQLRQNQFGNISDYLERMERSATRMQEMIDSLLELSRINTRGGDFQLVDLSQVVEEVLSDLEPRIQATSGDVMTEPLPMIEADPQQIRQLMQNLIGNALKFHQPGQPPQVHIYSQIDLSSARRTPSLTIVVEDHGIGFDPQHSERIFQPFQRLHGRSQYEGTGMGLAICSKIVERHHGAIDVTSQPGQGTAFFITLPIKHS